MKKSKLIEYSPILLVMIMVLVMSLHMHWQGDAVAFSFFIPSENEDFSFIPLNNIWEIWPSMCNHWHNSTGRFFSHAIVQLYCGFIGKTGFAISNALVWGGLILMILKMSRLKSYDFSLIAIASLLTFIVFFPLKDFQEQSFPFEPPHQINYVWMGLLNLAWIYCFLYKVEKKNCWYLLIALSIFSFLSGQSSEAFSIPIGCSISVYAFKKKFKMPLQTYLMAICYGIGGLLVILAPGNFHRLGEGSGWSLIHTVERMIPALLIPMVWCGSFLIRRKAFPYSKIIWHSKYIFFLTAIIVNFFMGFILGLESGVRMLTCANLLILVFVLINLADVQIKPLATVCIIVLLVMIGVYRYISICKLNDKNILVENLYHSSADGIVVLPDNLYLYQVREFIVRPHPFMMKERLINPSKPNIVIRPQSMMKLKLDMDTNLILPISDQAWLMIQSKLHPKEFKVEKTFLPGLLNFALPGRNIIWQDPYAVFDSTELWRAAIYINDRSYIRSTVKIDE